MRIEFGAIDAGEFTLAIDQNAAAATHSSAVDHDRIQADHSPNVLFAGHLGHSPHHRDRSNCQHQVDADTVFDQLAKLVGNETLVRVAAVVGGDHDRIADRAQFLLENYQLFVASTDNCDHAVAGSLERCGRGIGHGRSHASAYHDDGSKL